MAWRAASWTSRRVAAPALPSTSVTRDAVVNRHRFASRCVGTAASASGEASTSLASPGGATKTHVGPLKVFVSDWAHERLPKGHRFPLEKYRRVREELEGDASLAGRLDVVRAPLIEQHELEQVHDRDYVSRVFTGALSDKENRAIGFPWTPESVLRYRASAGGSLAAMHALMSDDDAMVASHAAGGTHHAFRDHGEGFCVL